MDPATSTSDSPPQRAPSSEPASTRPNPFDDGDVAARKRRRTSGSGDSLNQSRINDDEPASDQVITMDRQASTPRTPEEPSSDDSQRIEPPSNSKVTINLRKALSAHHEGPSPPPLPERIDPSLRSCVTADEAASIEVDSVRDHGRFTPPTGSSSPPIELVQDREDDDLDIQNTIEDISLGGHGVDLSDKILAFPYKESAEHPYETVERLIAFISSTQLELRVLVDVSNWLLEYIQLSEIAGPERRDEAFYLHDDFFTAMSKTLGPMLNRRPPLHQVPQFHDTITEFYTSFFCLTKFMIGRDLRLLQQTQASLAVGDKRLPPLRAPLYLEQVSMLVQYENEDPERDSPDARSEGESFAATFEELFGDRFQNVYDLMSSLIGLLPTFPALLDGFASSTFALLSLLNSLALRLDVTPHDATLQERAGVHLDRTHQLWPEMETCFYTLVDKSVTRIDKTAVLMAVDRLSSLLKLCARFSWRTMASRVNDFQERHSQLPRGLIPEAMCLEWKFDALGRLIRCSQMQLRVAGASNMCQSLVNLWKNHDDEPGQPVLQHIAAYLNRSAIIEYVLGPNSHPAIINESTNIIGFLAVTRTYEKRHTDQLWHAFTSSQDSRVADALARLIGGVTVLLDMTSLGDLCAKIDDRPFSDFTPSIRSLFDVIIKRMLDKSQRADEPLTYQPYALCLRLLRESTRLAQDARTAPQDIHSLLVHKLRELIRTGPELYHAKLYQSCLEDVSLKSGTTLGSLWCLTLAVTAQGAIVHEMEVLTREHDFARLLVEEIEHAVTSESQGDSILFGQVNKPRMDFLIQLLRHQPSAIGDGLGEKLWDVLVGSRCISLDDREVGWRILNEIRGVSKNPYIRSCYSTYLPKLPTEYFCEGTLRFIREELCYLLQQTEELHLDDEAPLKSSCLEQLWRLVLEVPDRVLAARAIHTLAREIHIESAIILSYPPLRARQVHSTFVNRCLSHLKESAKRIKGTETDEAMVVEHGQEKQERRFTRSLQLLTYFLAAHQSSSRFSAPDLRPFMSQPPAEVAGDLAQLKYQSFDGVEQTDVKPLLIGRLNTAASLLASIRQETGFPNYRAFYRGRPFLPSDQDVCKSLEDLQIRDGLILVKREEEDRSGSFKYKPGSSPLQAEILQHFQEMASYLEMKDTLAREVYEFLCRLPADISVIEAFEDLDRSHTHIFPSSQPYVAMYAAQALLEYKDMATTSALSLSDAQPIGSHSYELIRRRVLSLLVDAIEDSQLVPLSGSQLELELITSLLRNLFAWITDRSVTQQPVKDTELDIKSPEKFILILSMALNSAEKQAELLTMQAFSVLVTLSRHDHSFWDSIASNDTFGQLVGRLVLFDSRQSLRSRICKSLQSFNDAELQGGTVLPVTQLSRDPADQHQISRWFWDLGIRLLDKATSMPSQCSELMSLIISLTHVMLLARRDAIDLGAVAELASRLLISHETVEDINQAKPFDPVPRGLALILLECLQYDESIAYSSFLRRDIVYSLFWRHLFPLTREDNDQAVHRVVLNSETRQTICEVLLLLSKKDGNHYATLLQCLNEILPFTITDEDDSHYLYEIPSIFDRAKALRASCGYAGLRNLSNTCYLNSLLTQLYMNTGFREFLMSAAVGNADENRALLKEAKKVFGCLQESYHRFVDTEDFVSTIQQYDGCPIDIHNQMDVDEFYNLLFDRIEAQLPDSDAKRQFREFYGGQLVQQIKSKECSHISERLESFSAIQLDIKGKRCLQESLQTYIEGEVLEGDNKYKCSTCDNHVDAVKRACLKDLPNHVIFHLKRFDFNLFTLQRSKINDYFSFPEKIDLKPYTVEHLSDPTIEGEDVFELVGVLVHAGTSESGHYYSYIRERPCRTENPRWFEFNDDVVTEWDPANMEAAAFGGPDDRPPPFETGGMIYDKTHSAYMLFYERASKLQQLEQDVAASSTPTPVSVTMNAHSRSNLWDENTQILRRHCLFDWSHTQLVQRAFELLPERQTSPKLNGSPLSANNTTHLDDNNEERRRATSIEDPEEDLLDSQMTGTSREPHDAHGMPTASLAAKHTPADSLQDLAMEVALSHLDQIVSRKKETPDLKAFLAMLERATSQSVEAAQSYYKYFYLRPAAFRWLLQRNFDPDVRLGVGQQFLGVLRKISADAPYHYTLSCALPHRPIGVPVLNGVMHILKYLWSFFHMSIRSWDEYFSFILGFAEMGDLEVAQLLGEDYVMKLCQIIIVDRNLELSYPYSRLLTLIDRRTTGNRPPSYQQVLCLLHHLLTKLDSHISEYSLVANATDRLSQQTPFSWSTTEAFFLSNGLEGRSHSFLIEKLIRLDEEQRFVAPVVLRLAQRSERLDKSVALVLAQAIQPNACSLVLKDHLELAGLYLKVTTLPETAERLISHITGQVKLFHSEDVPAACAFYSMVLKLQREDQDLSGQIRSHALALIPEWAPIMLAHSDNVCRQKTIGMLNEHLFESPLLGFALDTDFGEDDQAQSQFEELVDIVRRLGIGCLEFLRDMHVLSDSVIGRAPADTITRVIKKCKLYFVEDTEEVPDRMHRDFQSLQEDLAEPLRRLIVDFVDDDGTDWEAESPRSEQLDGMAAEMNLQVTNDVADAEGI